MSDRTNDILISVVLPALRADAEYLRCVYGIRAALAGRVSFEIVSVVRNPEAFASLAAPDLRIFLERSPGIYAAMNQGLEYALGTYVYFIGQDDILLPAAAEAIQHGVERDADLILGDVFWGTNRIFKNPRSPKSLVWRNWCHQAIIYRREILLQRQLIYPVEFPVQGDHYMNIALTGRSSRLRIFKEDSCIAWYSASGFSTTHVDAAFRQQFPSLIRNNFGLLSYLTVVSRRALLKLIKVKARQ
jgi:glycosyltransferase involved in cell wall biosynthesis